MRDDLNVADGELHGEPSVSVAIDKVAFDSDQLEPSVSSHGLTGNALSYQNCVHFRNGPLTLCCRLRIFQFA
jgi:hypothetical protein